ncbi:MAG: tetratricopeptide repeat protein [Myxococcota bacterium]
MPGESTDGHRSMVMHDAKPSHSDIAALESAFASDPTSRAFQPLAEAYLALGRFMEAMVVCKKGVKAHPTDPTARVLMGRIYADQGKDRKAVEEFKAALELDENEVDANRLLGSMLLGQGETEEGTRLLERAAAAAPEDPKVKDACEKWGVKIPEAAPPQPPAAVPAPPPSAAQGPAGGAAPQQPLSRPVETAPAAPPSQPNAAEQSAGPDAPPNPVATAMAGIGAAASAPPAPAASLETPSAAPAPAPEAHSPASTEPVAPPADPVDYDPSLDIEDIDDPSRRSRLPMLITLGAVVLGIVLMLGWWGINARTSARVRKADELLAEAQQLLAVGSYKNYLEVARLAEEALTYQKRGELAATAHSYLAYVHTLRWGEHLEGEPYRELAVRHLEESEAEGENLTVRAAAQAYFDFFSGDTQKPIEELRASGRLLLRPRPHLRRASRRRHARQRSHHSRQPTAR